MPTGSTMGWEERGVRGEGGRRRVEEGGIFQLQFLE